MTKEIRKAAVLGGSGFAGYAMVEELVGHGYAVTTVNRKRTPASYSGPVERIAADRKDAAGFARALAAVEASFVVDVTAYHPEETQITIEAFRGRVSRFLHISTLSVYRWPFPCPVGEDWPLATDPLHGYGYQKANCERMLQSEPVERLPWTILRLPAVLGPRDPVSREACLCRQMIQGGHAIVPMQPFLCQNLFVQDAARAVRLLLESPLTIGRAYNAGGSPFRLADYVVLLAGLLGKAPRMARASAQVLSRDGFDLHQIPYFFEGDLVLDTRRIRNDAAFEPAFGLEQSLLLTLDWLSRNEETGTATLSGVLS